MLCNGGTGCCDSLGPIAAKLDDIARVIRLEQRGLKRTKPYLPRFIAKFGRERVER